MSVARTLSGRRLVVLGRPTKRDQKTTALILAAIRNGATRAEAAKAGGISRSTFQAWLAEGWSGRGGCAAFLASVRDAERDAACRSRLPTLEEVWAAKRKAETPPWARLTTNPDLRARRLARKKGTRPRVDLGGPEKLLDATLEPASTPDSEGQSSPE